MTISEIFNKMDWGTAPENDKNAKAWLKENGNKFGHFINGNFIDAKNHFKTKNPANNQFLANIAVGSKADVNLAVKSAAAAQNKWAQMGSCKGSIFVCHARLLKSIVDCLQF